MSYQELDIEKQAGLKARLQKVLRTNTYDYSTRNLIVSVERAEAI